MTAKSAQRGKKKNRGGGGSTTTHQNEWVAKVEPEKVPLRHRVADFVCNECGSMVVLAFFASIAVFFCWAQFGDHSPQAHGDGLPADIREVVKGGGSYSICAEWLHGEQQCWVHVRDGGAGGEARELYIGKGEKAAGGFPVGVEFVVVDGRAVAVAKDAKTEPTSEVKKNPTLAPPRAKREF